MRGSTATTCPQPRLPQACLSTRLFLPSDPVPLEGRTGVRHKSQPEALRGATQSSAMGCVMAVSSFLSVPPCPAFVGSPVTGVTAGQKTRKRQ